MLLHFYLVEREEAKQTVAAFLRKKLEIPWSKAKSLVEKGQVRVAGQPTRDPAHRLKKGNRVEVHGFSPIQTKQAGPAAGPQPKPKPKPRPKPVLPADIPLPILVYSDDALVVVNKPAGLTTMRHPEEAAEFGERGKHYLPVTLADVLPEMLGQPDRKVRAVHRIDRDTSGLVVFARTANVERELTKQFRLHTIERRYLAIVRGKPEAGKIESFFVRDRGDGRRGSAPEQAGGQKAITHVRLLEELGPFTLVECRLETGRTHQVRIHLGEQGAPICGERLYDRPLHGAPLPDASGAPRTMLHAARLAFTHPETGERMFWDCPLPKDMVELLERLRKESVSA